MKRLVLILAIGLCFSVQAKQRRNSVKPPWERLVEGATSGWVYLKPPGGENSESGDGTPGGPGSSADSMAGPNGTTGNGLGSGSLGGGGAGGAGSAAAGLGSDSSSGSESGASSTSGDGQSVEFKDDLAKGTDDRATPTGEGNGGGDHQNPPGGGGGGGNGSAAPVAYNHAFPVCVFMDESVGNGNQVVKGMVDQAADCEVNLVTFPIYVSNNYPNDPEGLKNTLRQKCNAVTGLGRMGMNRASVVMLTGNATLPKQMCGNPNGNSADIPYCAEMGFDPGAGLAERLPFTGRWGGIAGPGTTAVAVVGPNGHNPRDVSAAALGQAMMSLPPGSDAGNGVGGFEEGNAGSGAVAANAPEGWTNQGCERMRATAFPNANGRWKYKEDQRIYVVKGRSARLYDLNADRALFRDPNATPAGLDGGAGGNAGGGGGTGGGGSIFAEDVSGKHKKKPGGGSGGGRSGGAGGGGQVNSLRGSAGGLSAAAASAFDQNFFGLGESLLVDDYTGFGDSPAGAGGAGRDAATDDPSIRSIRKSPEGSAGGESTTIVFDDSAKRPAGESLTGSSGNTSTAAEGDPATFGPPSPDGNGLDIGENEALESQAEEELAQAPCPEGPEGDTCRAERQQAPADEGSAESEGGRSLASMEDCPEGEEGKECRTQRKEEEERKTSFLDEDFFNKIRLPTSEDDQARGRWRPRDKPWKGQGVIRLRP